MTLQLMYTCFIYYAKCIPDQFHICIRSMECEMNEWMVIADFVPEHVVTIRIC
jgi:hypothetical protein